MSLDKTGKHNAGLLFLLRAASRRYVMGLTSLLPLSSMRVGVLRLCGVKIGSRCYVGFGVRIDTNYPELIVIGDDVTISHECMLITHTQSPASPLLAKIYNQVEPIQIKQGAWVGARTIILPGAIIERDCLIGAGSTVHGTTKEGTVWAGNPIRMKRQLDICDTRTE